MGAWNFVARPARTAAAATAPSCGTSPAPPSASPASGSAKIHDREQRDLLTAALADL